MRVLAPAIHSFHEWTSGCLFTFFVSGVQPDMSVEAINVLRETLNVAINAVRIKKKFQLHRE